MTGLGSTLALTTPWPLGIEVEYADGLYIFDKGGKRYTDFISGISVSNIGHRHPSVIQAIKSQLEKHLHVMVYGEFHQNSATEFSDGLASLLPNNLQCIYPVNSGTEAIEASLKLAKRVTGRHKIVAFKGAYHGSTHGSLSVSGNEMKKYAFRPLLPDVHHIEFNNLSELSIIDRKTAAVIVEPIQGDAGVRIANQEFLTALRERCSETGAQLIFDEIQSGMGRTGAMFAFEHYNVIPDILALAKGLGGGMPIGAMVSSKEKMDMLTADPVLGHITTFGGHPINCAAAAANIQVLKKEVDFKEVERLGAVIEAKLKHKLVKQVRRKGMFFAIDMESPEIVRQVVEKCLEKGVITFWFLSSPSSFRIAPPLNITEPQVKETCGVISKVFEEISSSL